MKVLNKYKNKKLVNAITLVTRLICPYHLGVANAKCAECFSQIIARTNDMLRNDDTVCFIRYQQVELNYYSVMYYDISSEQQTVGRHKVYTVKVNNYTNKRT
jgi:hypothetical protein